MPRLHRFLAALMLAPAVLLAAPGAGFRALRVADPVGGCTMPGYVFYPSEQAGKDTRVGPYDVAATLDAPPRPGPKSSRAAVELTEPVARQSAARAAQR